MKTRFFLLVLTFGFFMLASCGPEKSYDAPKLIVMITLDQFRAGYLDRYDEVFTGGFRRLRDKGRWYDRAIVDHAATLSFPGHTTLATGAHPSTHGINTNSWLVSLPDGERIRYLALIDTTCQIVDYPDLTGLSPRNLRVTGMADWVRANDRDARAVALSTGTALAMAYGGRALEDESRNHAYWLSSSKGTFITSTFYRSEYPDWVASFNQEAMPWFLANQVWDNSVSEEHRWLAREDEASYEGDGTHTTFPHSFEDVLEDDVEATTGDDSAEAITEAYNRWFSDGPFADEALFVLANRAVDALSLGQRNTTDFLAIAVKSVDRNGHDYGPRSQEQLDILVRLDRLLESLLEHLDEVVGEQNYIITLSADHGAPNIVEYELEQGRPGQRVSEQDIQDVLDDIERLVDVYDGPEDELPERIARELERVDFIARAMTPEELAGTGPADEILRAYRNSYVPGRNTPFPLWTNEVLWERVGDSHPANWGIIVEFAENAQLWTARSAHGSSYWYDREVPIIFMGKGIKTGIATEPARTIDVAPTLAALANIDCPSTVDGIVLNVR
jgi:predicted AlkP superfamily pyrophosphatase or phosphodiesterase